MPFYSDASLATVLTAATVTHSLSDGSKNFLDIFANNNGSFDMTGVDRDLCTLTVQELSDNLVRILVVLRENADHKRKKTYKINLLHVVTVVDPVNNISDVTTLAIEANVVATVAPIFKRPVLVSGAATILVSDDKRDSIYTFENDDADSTFSIDATSTDAAKFTLTAGILSFASFEAADAKTEYSIKVVSTCGTNSALSTTATLTIKVINNRSPTFLTAGISAEGADVQSGNYDLVFTDTASTAAIAVKTLYLSQVCTYVLSGEDASHFSITTATNTPVLTLLAGLSHRNIAIYNLVVTATNSALTSASKIITLTRATDRSAPIVTLAAGNSTVAYVAASTGFDATFTVSDTYNQLLSIIEITTDENVTLTLTAGSGVTLDGTSVYMNAIVKNTSSTSSFNIVATDLNANVTTVPVVIKVTDQSAPIITASSPSTVVVRSANLTAMETVIVSFTSDETLLSTNTFSAGDFTVTNGALSGFAVSGKVATFNVTPTATTSLVLTRAVTVTLAANAVEDLKGNKNAVTTFSFLYDPTTPVFDIVGPNPYLMKIGHSYQEHNTSSTFPHADGRLDTSSDLDVNAVGDYFVKYVATSNSGLIKIAIRRVIVSAVGNQTGGVDFLLDMDISKIVSALSMKTIDADIDITRNLPRVDLDVYTSDFQNLFTLKTTGEEQFTSLPLLSLLATEDAEYNTRSENWPTIYGAATKYIAYDSARRLKTYPLDGNMVENTNHPMSAQSIPRAAFLKQLYEMFGNREHLGENIITNEAAILAEISTFLTTGMIAKIKTAIDGANNMTNLDLGPKNFVLTLIKQLHRAISGTENEKRLTNKEIFADNNQTADGFYKFLFRTGDTLSIIVKLTPTRNLDNFLTNSATSFEAVLKLHMVGDNSGVENVNTAPTTTTTTLAM